jgi:hypothetical protein
VTAFRLERDDASDGTCACPHTRAPSENGKRAAARRGRGRSVCDHDDHHDDHHDHGGPNLRQRWATISNAAICGSGDVTGLCYPVGPE